MVPAGFQVLFLSVARQNTIGSLFFGDKIQSSPEIWRLKPMLSANLLYNTKIPASNGRDQHMDDIMFYHRLMVPILGYAIGHS
jgi:hypothetical protein